VYYVLVGKLQMKRLIGTDKRRREDNVTRSFGKN
jgi:hypothetical protein